MTTDYSGLQVGQRVYYTGDVANQPAWCTIVKRDENPRWGLSYDLAINDDRPADFRGIRPSNFRGPGHRFETKEEHDAERAIKMAQMRACVEACASANRTS